MLSTNRRVSKKINYAALGIMGLVLPEGGDDEQGDQGEATAATAAAAETVDADQTAEADVTMSMDHYDDDYDNDMGDDD